MERYLVTGGAGFIGSHLVEKLALSGNKVIVLDDFSSGSRENLSLCRSEMVEIVEGDVRNKRALEEILPHVAGVFHLAALVSVPHSIREPGLSFDINTRGTQMLLDGARKAGGKKVVMASSAAIYGNSKQAPLLEGTDLNPLSPYGFDKLATERLGDMYANLYGMDVTALRFFNVFGPRQSPSSPYSGVISIFVNKLLHGEAATIYGDGEQTRDFIYVTDVVRALVASMMSPLHGFHVYNVACGKGVSINSIWEALCECLDISIVPTYVQKRMGDIRLSVADVTRVRQELNFSSQIEVKEGLLKTCTWAKEGAKITVPE